MTSTTEPDVADVDTATAELTAAETEAETLAREAAALEQAVVDGDTDVTAEQITQAGSLAHIAKLRAQAAANRLAKARADDAKRRRTTLAAHVDAFVAKHGTQGTVVLDVALEKFRAAVTAAAAECIATATGIRGEYETVRAEAHDVTARFNAVPEAARTGLGAPMVPSHGAERVQTRHDRPGATLARRVHHVAGSGDPLARIADEAIRVALKGR